MSLDILKLQTIISNQKKKLEEYFTNIKKEQDRILQQEQSAKEAAEAAKAAEAPAATAATAATPAAKTPAKAPAKK